MIDKTFKLFTLGELTKKSYMTPDGNEPPQVAIDNLENICKNWLEELCRRYNLEYVIYPHGLHSSFFNCTPHCLRRSCGVFEKSQVIL